MVAGEAAFFRFLLSIFYAGRWRKWVRGFQKHKLLHKHLMFWLSPGGEKEEKKVSISVDGKSGSEDLKVVSVCNSKLGMNA